MQNGTSLPEQNKGEGLTPKELIKKHLQDPNHKVTDEELKNLKVGSDAEDTTTINNEADALAEEVDDRTDSDALPNPYNVLR
jgi:hypothetical protein